jgi:hypothetical protein
MRTCFVCVCVRVCVCVCDRMLGMPVVHVVARWLLCCGAVAVPLLMVL